MTQPHLESRGCETGLQIIVWRADAVTFVVGGVPLFKPPGWNVIRFLGGCIIQNPRDGSE